MRILLLGNTGQLGWELERTLAALGELTACDFPALDLANPQNIRQVVHDCRPNLLVNATAYTAVDRAEDEPDIAYAINSKAPEIMAEEARKYGTALIHYSTDYVFDGHKGTPYVETDLPAPLSVYGRSKLEGEEAIQQGGSPYIILRTSWVYSLRRTNYVTKVLEWSRKQETLKLVSDQVSNPTWARMLAEATSQLICCGRDDLVGWFSEFQGIYHLAGSGYCSRYEWGEQILQLDPHKEQQVVRNLLEGNTAEFPTRAERPLFSALNCDLFYKTFHFQLPDWKFALKLAMESA
jgi:dTDP-4-dehydrorhamnose reductase